LAFLFWGTPLSAMVYFTQVMFAEDLAPPCRGRPQRFLVILLEFELYK